MSNTFRCRKRRRDGCAEVNVLGDVAPAAGQRDQDVLGLDPSVTSVRPRLWPREVTRCTIREWLRAWVVVMTSESAQTSIL
jgi:hypothetical protein